MNEQVAQSEEAFVRGMEHEPEPVEAQKPVWREHTFSISRSLFRIDGMAHRVLEVLGLVGLKARSMAERGPEDFDPKDDDIRRLASIIERLAQRSPDNGYREAPKDTSIKGIIVGCTVAMLGGAVGLSYQFAAMRAEFTEWKQATEYRLQQLERRP